MRGQRLELSEVEHHVQRCFPGAKDVVAALVPSHGHDLLFAFVEIHDLSDDHPNGVATDVEDLFKSPSEGFGADSLIAESRLYSRIPRYMVPTVFIPLAHMPHSVTGKIDRRRLQNEACRLHASQREAYQRSGRSAAKQRLPSTEPEKLLQSIWARLLHLDPCSIQASDHFFFLGGDSIVAMKLASSARDAGLWLTVADVFDKPRLCDLALLGSRNKFPESEHVRAFDLCAVDDPQGYFSRLQTLAIAPAQSELADIVPGTHVQSFFNRRKTLHHYTFSLTGPVDVERLRGACQVVTEKHSVLRTVFTVHENQLAQVIVRNVELPFQQLADISDLAALQKSLWEADATGNHVAPGLPTKFLLLSGVGARRHVLIVRLIHAQWDGVCISVLFEDMARAYRGQSQLLPTVDFSACVYFRAQQPRAEAFGFWRRLLEESTVTSLGSAPATPRRRASGTTVWKDQWISPMPEPPAGVTTATLIKAAWAHVLSTDRPGGCRLRPDRQRPESAPGQHRQDRGTV